VAARKGEGGGGRRPVAPKKGKWGVRKPAHYRDMRQAMDEEMLTVEAVRALIEKCVMKNKGPLKDLKMPDDEALATLTLKINGPWVNTYLDQEREKNHGDPGQFYREHADAISKIFPKYQKYKKELLEKNIQIERENLEKYGHHEYWKSYYEERIRGLEGAMRDLEEAATSLARLRQFDDRFFYISTTILAPDAWKRWAPHCANELIVALKSTNPDADIGISNEGPVARFVADALTHVTRRQTPLSAGTVANFLKNTRD
jgi:hypothetical protein